MATIETALLRERLSYDPETGIFTHLVGRLAGREAGSVSAYGYLRIKIRAASRAGEGHGFLAHRLAWQYVTGSPPQGEIDHVNGDRLDNRFCNLRIATDNQQQWNTGIRKNNTSGFRGVRYREHAGKWAAAIQIRRKHYFLGYYDTPEQASEAYEAAALKRSGEFYREPANDNRPANESAAALP